MRYFLAILFFVYTDGGMQNRLKHSSIILTVREKERERERERRERERERERETSSEKKGRWKRGRGWVRVTPNEYYLKF